MKMTKSKSSYTNVWLRRNKHMWYEQASLIMLRDREHTPKIVRDRVDEINSKKMKPSNNDDTREFLKDFLKD